MKLELTESEILWLSNIMCSESDGSKESNSLEKKIYELYQDAFHRNNK